MLLLFIWVHAVFDFFNGLQLHSTIENLSANTVRRRRRRQVLAELPLGRGPHNMDCLPQ